MAIKKSASATNRDATPRILVNGALTSGRLRGGIGKCDIASGETVGNQLICVTDIPSNVFVRSVKLWCPAIATATAVNIGLYRTTADSPAGGATNTVVSASLFAAAQVLTAALNGTEISHASGTFTNAMREQPLWQALGLAADPGVLYDLSATVTTTSTAAGLIVLSIDFV
jgi:hypothetical protein